MRSKYQSLSLTDTMAQKESEIQAVEMQEHRDEPAQDAIGPLMRSKEDSLGIWRTVLRHKRLGLIAMTAAFCASLDGYRESQAYLLTESSLNMH